MTLPDRGHDHRNRCSRSTGNRRSPSTGTSVHDQLELVFTIRRNAQGGCSKSGRLAAVGLSDTSSQAMRETGGRAGYKVIALSPSSTRASG